MYHYVNVLVIIYMYLYVFLLSDADTAPVRRMASVPSAGQTTRNILLLLGKHQSIRQGFRAFTWQSPICAASMPDALGLMVPSSSIGGIGTMTSLRELGVCLHTLTFSEPFLQNRAVPGRHEEAHPGCQNRRGR